jgi:hypothetical protein
MSLGPFRGFLCTLALVALGAAPPDSLGGGELTHITPPPQPPLVALGDSLGEVRVAFNAAANRPRVLLMLSPT